VSDRDILGLIESDRDSVAQLTTFARAQVMKAEAGRSGFRWNWLEFIFTTLANTAGTGLALGVAALYASMLGYLDIPEHVLLLGLVGMGVLLGGSIAFVSYAYRRIWISLSRVGEYMRQLQEIEEESTYDGIPRRPRDTQRW
jgi:hypothetical protein